MFYEDVMNYIKNGDILQKSIQQNDKNKISDIEIQIWCKMYEEACRIYKLYIKTPTAPLEINICNNVREDIYHNFRFIRNKNGIIGITEEIPLFPDISGMKLSDTLLTVKSFSLAFDSALLTIMKLIDRDIFPRFKTSKSFKTAVNEFTENLNL